MSASSNRERIEMVSQDCTDDARNLDGEPMTGAVMGRILGEHLAMMKALADSMLVHEEQLERLTHGTSPRSDQEGDRDE